jgi:hypothetical protein
MHQRNVQLSRGTNLWLEEMKQSANDKNERSFKTFTWQGNPETKQQKFF